MDNDLGYLPGSKEEAAPLDAAHLHQLDILVARLPGFLRKMLDDMVRRGTSEMEPLTYIRGRSIPKQFVICDEAQNLSPHMIKTLLTRVGEGTKIVFTGDPETYLLPLTWTPAATARPISWKD